MKAKIYVNQQENDKFFGSKLSTYRDGFCHIERSVIMLPADELHDDGELGFIKVNGRNLLVTRCGQQGEFDVYKWEK